MVHNQYITFLMTICIPFISFILNNFCTRPKFIGGYLFIKHLQTASVTKNDYSHGQSSTITHCHENWGTFNAHRTRGSPKSQKPTNKNKMTS